MRLEIRETFEIFIEHLRRDPPLRIPGVAIVLGRMAKGVPLALSHKSTAIMSCTKACCWSP